MEINPNLSSGSLRSDASPAEVRNWRVGQVLSAVATSADRGGHADLRIGGQTYQAQVPFSVRPGDRMLLEVVRSGTTPLLRPVGAERSPDPAQAALRSALPRQGPLPPLLANLAQLASARRSPPLPSPVLDAARMVFQQFSTARETGTADGLRRAMGNAGTTLESKLALAASGRAAAGALGADFKAGLLRIREAVTQELRLSPPAPRSPAQAQAPVRAADVRTMPLATAATPTSQTAPATQGTGAPTQPAPAAASGAARTVPPLLPPLAANQPQAQSRAAPFPALLEPIRMLHGLLQQVESSLARLQLNQLASQGTDGDQRQVWLLELPVRRDQAVDVLHLRIERETENDGANRTGTGWTVRLAFDLDGLGPVQARVGLHSGLVSTAFWSERAATNDLLQRHLNELRQQLLAAGLDVGSMSCQVGQPQPPSPPPSSGILDEQA